MICKSLCYKYKQKDELFMNFHTWTTKGVSQHNSKEGEKLILLLLLIWIIFVLQIHNCVVYIYLIYDCGPVVSDLKYDIF